MSDHKAEAENSLDLVADIPFGDGDFERRERYYLALAQVHATLYLAEQQKRTADEAHLANLIAYVAIPAEQGDTPSDAWPLINEGLGLS